MNDIELILKYQQKELSSDELIDFQNRLSSDQEFNNLYNDVIEADQLLIFEDLSEAKNILDGFDYSDNKSSNGFNKIFIISGLIIIGSIFYWFLNQSKPEKVLTKNKIVEQKSDIHLHKNENVSEIKSVTTNSSVDKIKNITPFNTENQTQTGLIDFDSKIANIDIQPVVKNENNEINFTTTNIPCKLITASYESEPACIGKNNGKIIIKNLKDANLPVHVFLNNKFHGISNEIIELKGGLSYSIKLIDINNCESKVDQVEVEEINCNSQIKNYPKAENYIVSLLAQNELVIKDCPEKASFEIKDQKGMLIFQKEISNTQNTWNLQSMQGGQIAVGYYFYSLKNLITGEESLGSITIIE